MEKDLGYILERGFDKNPMSMEFFYHPAAQGRHQGICVRLVNALTKADITSAKG